MSSRRIAGNGPANLSEPGSGLATACLLALIVLLVGSPVFAQTPGYLWTNFAGLPGGIGNADAMGSVARFNNPGGVAVDSSGNVYVADRSNAAIRKMTSAGVVSTYVGTTQLSGTTNATGAAARFFNPEDLVWEASTGNLYVLDRSNTQIRKVTTAGVVTVLAGATQSAGTADGTGAAAHFNDPWAIAIDSSGNLFVADSNNHLIRKVTPAGVVTTIAGTVSAGVGVSGHADHATDPLSATFNTPRGIAVDNSTGYIYVSDTNNHTIRCIIPGVSVSTLAGLASSSGSTDGTGNVARFNSPYGLRMDLGVNIIVIDRSNATIRQVTTAGVVTTLAGTAANRAGTDGTGTAARFYDPQGAAVDSAGNLYIADTTNCTIRKMTPGKVVTTLAGLARNFGSTNASGGAARFNTPQGAVFDTSGNLFIADTGNNLIRKVTSAGVVTTFAGQTGAGFTNATGTAAQFRSPAGLVIDASNNIYVADSGNHAIRMITSAGVVTTVAGTGSTGVADGTGTAASFNSPQDVTLDSTGNLWVADTSNHTIRRITSGGVVNTVAGTAGSSGTTNATGTAARFNNPSGLGFDTSGNLYIADRGNHSIRMMTPSFAVSTYAGLSGTLGNADGALNTARFWNPYRLLLDSSGYLYVSDTNNHTIRKISPAGQVSTLGGAPAFGSSQDGLGAQAWFSSPREMAIKSNGQVYLTDSNNNRIAVGTPQAPIATGTATFVSTTSATINAMVSPNGTPATAQLDYGTSTSYGTTIPLTLTPNDDVSLHSIATPLTGLTAATTYHYRITSTNSIGATTSGDALLTTLNAPEIAVEQPAGTGLGNGSSTIAFGSAIAGSPGMTNTFTVRSIGVGALGGISVNVDGTNASDFSVNSTTLPATLPSGASATFNVAFTPSGLGTRSATVHISSSDPGKPSFDVTLAGTGLAFTAMWNAASDVPLSASSFTALGTVSLTLNFAPPNGTNLTVVNNTGTSPISGTFSNLAQGQAVPLTYSGVTYNFVANYYGGTGNDLVLEVPGLSQSVSLIEPLTSLDAPRITDGLGWNVTLTNEWEFAKVQAAGGKEVRIQFGWPSVESMTGTLSLTNQFKNALSWCQKYGLQPLIVAAYGPPYSNLINVTVTSATPVGSYVIPVTPVSGQLSSVIPPYCHVLQSNGSQIVAEGKWAYYGAIIDSVNTGASSITIGAATTVALPAGTTLTIKQLLYPSVATGVATDPSLVAYARYVRYLAGQIAAYGLTGKVEVWNEPPWTHDPWDHRGAFYDTVPGGITTTSPNWGMLDGLLNDSPPTGVRYTWGGSHKSGFRGVMEKPMPVVTQAQVANAVPSGGWHPYGNTPEDHAWYPGLLLSAGNVFTTQLVGTNASSNFKSDRKVAANNLINLGWTATEQVSETGLFTADELMKARFNLRTFLVMMCLGPAPQLERMNFYRLADVAGGYGFINSTTQAELPSYTAMKGLMNDVAAMGVAPVSYTTADLPTVTAPYSGYFPLTTIPVAGRSSSTDTQNSFLFMAYQRSYGAVWTSLASPPAVPITVNLPPGTGAQAAWDLVTRQPVSFSISGSTVTYAVADNPVALKIIPLPIVATLGATSVTATGATLNGTVNANNSSAAVSFDYGTSIFYSTNIAGTPTPVTGSSATAVSASVTGLTPGATYHFRVNGVNDAGTTNGSDVTFITLSSNASLSDLSLSAGSLSPSFISGTLSYTASVPFATTSVSVTPSVAESHATVKVNNVTVASGNASGALSLSVGLNEINTVVTAQDGTTTQAYALVLTRQITTADWRQIWYGTTINSGNAADTADPYHTGIPNLAVFAFLGSNQDPSTARISQLPQVQRSGGNFFYSFTPSAGVAGITYGADWRAALNTGNWQSVADTGSGNVHTFSIPMGSNTKLFLRLKVTSP